MDIYIIHMCLCTYTCIDQYMCRQGKEICPDFWRHKFQDALVCAIYIVVNTHTYLCIYISHTCAYIYLLVRTYPHTGVYIHLYMHDLYIHMYVYKKCGSPDYVAAKVLGERVYGEWFQAMCMYILIHMYMHKSMNAYFDLNK